MLTTEAVQASDVVITMGCGDACPVFPGEQYRDWKLDDPAGQGVDVVRLIRDRLRLRAQVVLHAARGRSNARIARETGLHLDTVREWRGRFAVGG